MKIQSYLLPLCLLVFAACTKEVDLKIEGQESKLVLNGVVMQDSVLRVHLSVSRAVTDVRPLQHVHDAALQLFEEGKAVGNWIYIDEGVYEAVGVKPKAGMQYTLQVSAAGLAPVEARVSVPAPVQHVEVLSAEKRKDGSGYFRHTVRLRLQDDAETKDFYKISRVRMERTFQGEQWYTQVQGMQSLSSETVGVFSSCEGDWGWDMTGCKILMGDGAFQGGDKEVLLNFLSYSRDEGSPSIDDREYLLVSKVSEAYYKYMLSLYHNQVTEGNPFAEPAPVYMNVVGGYGVLGASSTTWLPVQ